MSHRKYVKGKRSKVSKQKSPTEDNIKKMDSQQKPQVTPQVDFLSRVAKFPLVHSAVEYASDAYAKTKVSFHFSF